MWRDVGYTMICTALCIMILLRSTLYCTHCATYHPTTANDTAVRNNLHSICTTRAQLAHNSRTTRAALPRTTPQDAYLDALIAPSGPWARRRPNSSSVLSSPAARRKRAALVVIREAYCRSAKECEREKRMSAWTCVCVCLWVGDQARGTSTPCGSKGGGLAACGMWQWWDALCSRVS